MRSTRWADVSDRRLVLYAVFFGLLARTLRRIERRERKRC